MGARVKDKHQLFVEEYLRLGSPSKAAEAAGYAPSYGSELLRRPDVRRRVGERVEKRLREVQMDADEVLKRLADIARGGMVHFTHIDADGHVVMTAADADAARANLHLVKKVSFSETQHGKRYSLEVADPLAALTTLAKYHRLVDRAQEENWREALLKVGIAAAPLFDALVQQIEDGMLAEMA